MARRIYISTICQDIQNYSALNRNFNLTANYINSKSTSKFDEGIVKIITYFSSYVICVATKYYSLQSHKSCLLKSDIDVLNHFRNTLLTRVAADNNGLISDWVVDGVAELDKWVKLDAAKGDFFKGNRFIENDKSPEHYGAFLAENVNDYPEFNLLIKFTFNKVHIRCGINMTNLNRNQFTILNFWSKHEIKK